MSDSYDAKTCKKITKQEYLAGVTNSIKLKYPELRAKSKAPTFALQYMGNAYTLVRSAGFSEEVAQNLEKQFHLLYKVSDELIKKNIKFMQEYGYIECAFGLKLQTPILKQCILDNEVTPPEAAAEVRSANNAYTQSWGMLLNRAMIATEQKIMESPYSTEIIPINMIHDAGYFLVKKKADTLKFLNDTLIKEMEWNDHPKIKSDKVPLTAELEVGKSWDKMHLIKNNASLEEIANVINSLE